MRCRFKSIIENFVDYSRGVQELTGVEIINRKRNIRKYPLEPKIKEWTHYTSVYLNGTHKPSPPIRCTTLIIHCCYMFRPQVTAIFRELQTS